MDNTRMVKFILQVGVLLGQLLWPAALISPGHARAEDQAVNPGSSVTACFGSIHQALVIIEPCERALMELSSTANDPETTAEVKSALAIQFARKSQLPQSRVLLEEAIADSPQNLTVLVNLGSLNVYEGNFDAALAAYDRALAMRTDPYIYLNRSLALRALGRYAQAQNDYDAYASLINSGLRVAPQPTSEIVSPAPAPVSIIPVEDRSSR
jgi:tetratricopeptide (TPR) repeat protein